MSASVVRWPLPAAVVAVGTVVGLAVAAVVGARATDTVALVVLAAGGSGIAAAGTSAVLRSIPGRSLATHALVLALGSIAVTAAGVLLSASFMFLNSHDLGVLAIVLVLSAAAAAAAAIALGGSFRSSVATVAGQAEALARGHVVEMPELTEIATAELRRLSRVLTVVGRDLVDSREREHRLEHSRRELVAWVSHDLRSPIGAIRAMAEALEDGVVNEPGEVVAYHRAIGQEAQRLAGLVDDLFELSRIQAGERSKDDDTFVELHELVGEILEAACLRGATRDVRVVGDLGRTGPQLVVAAELRRALDNVIDNAIRHTPVGGTVTVRVGAANGSDGAVVTVEDECGGIPEADLARIFDVAFRGDMSRARDTGGAGLGLAIAKGLVEARAGAISVGNTDEGCEFMVHLPAEGRR